MKYIPIDFDEYIRSQASEEKQAIAMEIWLENGLLRIRCGHLDYIDFGGGGHYFPLDSQGRKLHPMGEEKYKKLEEGDRLILTRSRL